MLGGLSEKVLEVSDVLLLLVVLVLAYFVYSYKTKYEKVCKTCGTTCSSDCPKV